MKKPLDPAETAQLLEKAIVLFVDVKRGLDVSKSLGWQLSVDSLKLALNLLGTTEAMRFLDEFLMKMVTILITQSPSKLGQFERKCIEESLSLAMTICLRLLPEHPRFLPVLVKIFDPTPIYYAGVKIGWSQTAGFPQVRVMFARKFADNHGFAHVLALLKHPEQPWLGTEALAILLKALCESIAQVQDQVREELIATVAKSLLTLSDEQLKRENTEHLNGLIRALCHAHAWTSPTQPLEAGVEAGVLAFQSFWLEHTLKVINCGSLVLKLFGWDQVQELIREAYQTRPYAVSYVIKGGSK